MNITLYHNPRCSKSRATLALLQARGFAPSVVEYLNDTPSAETLDAILRMLGLEPRAFMRTKEAAYAESGADEESLSRAELIALMVRHPVLIERPIVVVDDERAAIGRPPEAVLEIL